MFTLALCIPIQGLILIAIIGLLVAFAIPDIKEHIGNIKQIFKRVN